MLRRMPTMSLGPMTRKWRLKYSCPPPTYLRRIYGLRHASLDIGLTNYELGLRTGLRTWDLRLPISAPHCFAHPSAQGWVKGCDLEVGSPHIRTWPQTLFRASHSYQQLRRRRQGWA